MKKQFDTVIVGAGSAGSALAARLIETTSSSVLLLEAGPDYGSFSEGRWPFDLLNFRALPESHLWSNDGDGALPRARIVGGGSSVSGCTAIWGSRLDYDGWARSGLDGWASDDLLPLFEEAEKRLRVYRYQEEELTPFQRGWVEAAPGLGIERSANLNDLNEDVGIGPTPVCVADGVRWNAAFAFLDAVRDSERLTIQANAVVDRLLVRDGQVVGVEVSLGGETCVFEAARTVLAAGAYGSPAVLQRSGIGDPDTLRAARVPLVHPLPGVGKGLQDHPAMVVSYAGTPELEDKMHDFAKHRDCPEEQTIAKARSRRCEEGFDLHLCPVGGFVPGSDGEFRWSVVVANMAPTGSDHLRIVSGDPHDPPCVYRQPLADRDAEVLVDGIDLVRRAAAVDPLSGLLGPEVGFTAAAADGEQLVNAIRHGCGRYGHPVGTCRMGLADDPGAVVDHDGRVLGLEGLLVADCSIMPRIPRANTGLPATVVGLRIADALRGDA